MMRDIIFAILFLFLLLLAGETLCFGSIATQAVRETGEIVCRKAAGTVTGKTLRQTVKHETAFIANNKAWSTLYRNYGDDAIGPLLKHGDNAGLLIEAYGKPAIPVFNQIGKHNGRRLVRMQTDGDLAQIGRTDEILAVIKKYGDNAMEFIWQNKGSLAVVTVLAVFLANPEPFINGTQSLVTDGMETVTQQLAAPVIAKINWTLTFLSIAGIAIACVIVIPWIGRKIHLRAIRKKRLDQKNH